MCFFLEIAILKVISYFFAFSSSNEHTTFYRELLTEITLFFTIRTRRYRVNNKNSQIKFILLKGIAVVFERTSTHLSLLCPYTLTFHNVNFVNLRSIYFYRANNL